MNENYQTPWDVTQIGHYVGNYISVARICIEKKKSDEAEETIRGLIKKLEDTEQTDLIIRFTKLVKDSDLKSLDGINKFREAYHNFPEVKKNEEIWEQVVGRLKTDGKIGNR